MTREEAVQRIREGLGYQYSPPAETFVDSAVALGLLKLDEPVAPIVRAFQAITAGLPGSVADPGRNLYCANRILESIDLAGLKIVEK